MDKASGFRYPFMMLLSLACTCSFALAFAWRGSGLHEGAFLVEFYTNGHVQEVNENAYKYFHEAGPHQPGDNEQLGHYDARFFQGKLREEEKRDIQVHMVRAYLDTFRQLGLEAWIAHGTLLGWWWNRSVRPSDISDQGHER